jgi:hypothetical protein
MPILIYELLLSEVWKSQVLPLLQKEVLESDSLKTYFLV